MDKDKMKRDSIEMLQNVEDEHCLFYIYGTIKAAYMEQEASKQGIIEKV